MLDRGLWRIHPDGSVWKYAEWRHGKALLVTPKRIDRKNKHGYMAMSGYVDGRYFTCFVHRLVWQATVGQIPDGLVINHKNCDPSDNRIENLEVVTYSENMLHAIRAGRKTQWGDKNPAAKISNAAAVSIREEYARGGVTLTQLGAKYGIAYQTVSKIVRGERRTKQKGPVGRYESRRLTGLVRDVNGRYRAAVRENLPMP